jgi:hypothetical protein
MINVLNQKLHVYLYSEKKEFERRPPKDYLSLLWIKFAQEKIFKLIIVKIRLNCMFAEKIKKKWLSRPSIE